MQVVLLERIEKLGQMGDVVTVKNGYARNYLLPRQKALRATQGNIAQFEERRGQLEADNLKNRQEAEAVGAKLDGEGFMVFRQAGELGQLYGSVSTRDIAGMVTEGGFTINRSQVMQDTPIKMLGLHTVRIQMHPEVHVSVTVNVARNAAEAEMQAKGLSVDAAGEDEQETITAEDVFESEALAQEAETSLAESDAAAEGPESDGAASVDESGDAPQS